MENLVNLMYEVTPFQNGNNYISFSDKVNNEIKNCLNGKEWRRNENANRAFTYNSLISHVAQLCMAEYTLHKLPEEYTYAHRTGWLHIHDLGTSSVFIRYCSGLNLESLILDGIKDVGIGAACSKPARHLRTLLNHMLNYFLVSGYESAGAISFTSVDIYCAPYIREDRKYYANLLNLDINDPKVSNLIESEVKQALQEFIWNLGYPLRGGTEALFTNITLELDVSYSDLKDRNCLYAGNILDYTYAELQDEVNLFNKCLFEVMLEGQPNGQPFTFPIITINMTPDFHNVVSEEVRRLIAEYSVKYGSPYFQNCVNGELGLTKVEPGAVRSMCCRLLLDKKEVSRRVGGFFSGGMNTGSICVTTINLPRLGYISKGDLDKFFIYLDEVINLSIKGMIKRKKLILENIKKYRLTPYILNYENPDMPTYFITVGYTGLHECLVNLGYKDGLDNLDNLDVAEQIMKFMYDKVHYYQEQYNTLINLEATPAEGASYRLAKLDRKYFSDKIYFVDPDNIFYTNSCLPSVYKQDDFIHLTAVSDRLLKYHTGGCVTHYYTVDNISIDAFYTLVNKICDTNIPYFTITKIVTYCDECKKVLTNFTDKCPYCGNDNLDYITRVVGYARSVKFWNDGKKAEFNLRNPVAFM